MFEWHADNDGIVDGMASKALNLVDQIRRGENDHGILHTQHVFHPFIIFLVRILGSELKVASYYCCFRLKRSSKLVYFHGSILIASMQIVAL